VNTGPETASGPVIVPGQAYLRLSATSLPISVIIVK
jgi:hypothetical protein